MPSRTGKRILLLHNSESRQGESALGPAHGRFGATYFVTGQISFASLDRFTRSFEIDETTPNIRINVSAAHFWGIMGRWHAQQDYCSPAPRMQVGRRRRLWPSHLWSMTDKPRSGGYIKKPRFAEKCSLIRPQSRSGVWTLSGRHDLRWRQGPISRVSAYPPYAG